MTALLIAESIADWPGPSPWLYLVVLVGAPGAIFESHRYNSSDPVGPDSVRLSVVLGALSVALLAGIPILGLRGKFGLAVGIILGVSWGLFDYWRMSRWHSGEEDGW